MYVYDRSASIIRTALKAYTLFGPTLNITITVSILLYYYTVSIFGDHDTHILRRPVCRNGIVVTRRIDITIHLCPYSIRYWTLIQRRDNRVGFEYRNINLHTHAHPIKYFNMACTDHIQQNPYHVFHSNNVGGKKC